MRNLTILDARKILAKKGSEELRHDIAMACIGGSVTHGKCLAFRDEEICIVGSQEDLSLQITIFGPRQSAGRFGNPAVMVNRNGECIRYHGEMYNFEDRVKQIASD